jgi:hypothetical protein
VLFSTDTLIPETRNRTVQRLVLVLRILSTANHFVVYELQITYGNFNTKANHQLLQLTASLLVPLSLQRRCT